MNEENKEVMPVIAAWDLKDLEARIKDKGLPQIEGLAKSVFEAVCDWAEHGVKNSESKIDDFALAVLPPFKSFVISKLEGISK